jgi:uncharacterized protein (TIGR03435 family)
MRLLFRLSICPVLAFIAVITIARAQQTPAAPAATQPMPASAAPQAASVPAFDVAAIHRHISEPHEHNSIWSSPSDSHFKAENVTLSTLVHWAFEMPETRIRNLPGWADATYFNIDASSDASADELMKNLTPDAGTQQKKKMVQALLAARFKLATHIETRDLPVYLLVVARVGPKLRDLQTSESFVNTSVNAGSHHIQVQMANSVAVLAEELSRVAGRDVIDKTGITGRYNLDLTWSADDRAAPSAAGASTSPADTGPSIFTALQEQLGLKLEPGKGPVQVLVIDHVEMPSEN